MTPWRGDVRSLRLSLELIRYQPTERLATHPAAIVAVAAVRIPTPIEPGHPIRRTPQ